MPNHVPTLPPQFSLLGLVGLGLLVAGLGTTLVPEIALPQLVDNDRRIAKVPLAEPGPQGTWVASGSRRPSFGDR